MDCSGVLHGSTFILEAAHQCERGRGLAARQNLERVDGIGKEATRPCDGFLATPQQPLIGRAPRRL